MFLTGQATLYVQVSCGMVSGHVVLCQDAIKSDRQSYTAQALDVSKRMCSTVGEEKLNRYLRFRSVP